jgi:VIT1/CCC1 family predicted Fe2+/Mn2+ transporter
MAHVAASASHELSRAPRPADDGSTAPTGRTGPAESVERADHRRLLERATLREILMGAQDNLTNVLAVVLGVTIGAGRAELVALAGLSAAIAESVSMGGVLYSSTRASQGLERADGLEPALELPPVVSGLTTAVAALLGGLVPLAPFAVLPLGAAVATSVAVSVASLFVLGSVTGHLSRQTWWRDGLRLVAVAALAALAAAIVGTMLAVD